MSISPISLAFKKCKEEKRPALLTYTVAGDNTKKKSLEILNAISNHADICEIGFPHNTPIADGGQIQTSAYRAIKNGIKMKDVFQIVKNFKKNKNAKPVILMGYYNMIYQYNENKFLEKCILTTVRDKKNEKLIAFNCLPLLDVTLKNKPIYFVHLGLVMIDPDNRSKGLVWILYGLTVVIMFCRHRLKPIWISNVTQVPAVVGLVSEGFDSVYPDALKDSRRTFDHISLVRQIMLNHRHMFGVGHEAEFDEKSFIIKNAYTGGSNNLLKSWDEVAKHRNDQVNNFCSERLDYNRGDDFIQIAKLDFFNLQRYIIRVVPIKSLAMILNNIILVILQSILLPIYYWFKSDTSTMDLKPRG